MMRALGLERDDSVPARKCVRGTCAAVVRAVRLAHMRHDLRVDLIRDHLHPRIAKGCVGRMDQQEHSEFHARKGAVSPAPNARETRVTLCASAAASLGGTSLMVL